MTELGAVGPTCVTACRVFHDDDNDVTDARRQEQSINPTPFRVDTSPCMTALNLDGIDDMDDFSDDCCISSQVNELPRPSYLGPVT